MLWWNLEALSRLVERAVKGAMFQEFQEEVKRGVSLSFPPLFCWWLTCLLMAQMWAYLRCVLLCFEAVSKLSVNLDKSELHENSFLKMFIPLKKAIKCPWGLAQVVKGWRGFVGGYRFKSQWGPKIYLSKRKKKVLFLIKRFFMFLSLLVWGALLNVLPCVEIANFTSY